MTAEAATAFLDRVETDETLSNELRRLRGDPAAALATVRAAGFDVSSDELREAALERYGGTLTVEQLDRIAAGGDLNLNVTMTADAMWAEAAMAAF
jgi:predicted ribosomally synthesized peptide with nif11-like leader